MAMQFARAERPENPDLAVALARQTEIANQLKAAERQADASEKTGLLTGGAMLAQAAPEGTFTNAWNTLTGTAEPAAAATQAALPQASMAASPLAPVGTAAPQASLAATPAASIAAPVAEGAAAGTAAAGAGAGGSGLSAALTGMGPIGWASLAALGLGLLS